MLLTNFSYATFLSLDDGKSTGSGFRLFFNEDLFIVTAKHVLYEDDQLRFNHLLVTCQNVQGNNDEPRTIIIDKQYPNIHPSPESDVAIIKIEDSEFISIEREGSNIINVNSEQIKNLNEILISNEVYLSGFPSSLLYQGEDFFEPDKPLLRRGIVSGINSNNNTFIIDCSAYFGNSGGPIIEKLDDDLKIIGVVSRYIPFVTEWRNNREASFTRTEFYNSGYTICTPMDAVTQLINSVNS